MRFAKHLIWIVFSCLFLCTSTSAQKQKRAIQFDDMIAMHRLSDPQVSPDGKWVAYVVATPDMQANHSMSNIWVVPANGGEERQLTRSGSDSRPRWSPDGKQIAFLSSRDGATQIYVMSVFGGEASRVTFLSTTWTTRFGLPMANGWRSFRAFTPIAATTLATKLAMKRPRKIR